MHFIVGRASRALRSVTHLHPSLTTEEPSPQFNLSQQPVGCPKFLSERIDISNHMSEANATTSRSRACCNQHDPQQDAAGNIRHPAHLLEMSTEMATTSYNVLFCNQHQFLTFATAQPSPLTHLRSTCAYSKPSGRRCGIPLSECHATY